jgi:hypothetical protein
MSFILKADWPNLQVLRLNNSEFSRSLQWGGSRWKGLRYLGLEGAHINDEGAAALARGNWPLLSLINLQHNIITSAGANALAGGNWPKL